MTTTQQEAGRFHDPLEWMRTITTAADAAQAAASIRQAVATIIHAGQQFGFARARLWLLSADMTTLEGAGQVGDAALDAFVGLQAAVVDSRYTQQILTTREPWVYHGQQFGPWLLTSLLPQSFVPPVADWVHLPLWTADRCWGVLTLDNANLPCVIDEQQLAILGLFSCQMATALSHVQLVEQEAREHQTYVWLRELVTITEALQRAASIEAVAEVIVGAAQAFGFARTRLWVSNNDGSILIAAGQHGNLGLEDFKGFKMAREASPYTRSALEAQSPVVFHGSEHGEPVLMRAFAQHGYQAPEGQWVSIPLLLDAKRLLGVLTVDSWSTPARLMPTQIEVLNLLGRQAAVALERARQSYEQHWLATLTAFEQAVQGDHTVNDIAAIIVAYGRQLNFARVRLWSYDVESNILVGLSQIGEDCPDFTAKWMPLVASSYGRSELSERAPIFFSGRPEEQIYLDYNFEEQGIAPPTDEWASVPLWTDTTFIGLLELDDAQRTRSLYPGQRDLLRLLGQQATAALDRAMLHERQQQHAIELGSKNQKLSWLAEIIAITGEAQQALHLREVADVITRGGQRLGFRRARLWLLTDDRTAMTCISHVGDATDMLNFRIPLKEAVYAKQILRAPSLVFFSDRATHPAYLDRHAALEFSPPTGDWVGIPFRADSQRVIGMLVLDYADEQQVFSDTQRELLRLFGQQSELALERARLYEAEHRQSFERNWLECLVECAVEMQKAQTVEQLQRSILDGACALGFGRVRLWRFERDALVGEDLRGDHGQIAFKGMRLELKELPYGQRLRLNRQPFVCTDVMLRLHTFYLVLCAAGTTPPRHRWLEVPLHDGTQRPWGLLTLDTPNDERLLDDDQRSLIALFQRQVDVALMRTRLYEQRTAMLEQTEQLGDSLYALGGVTNEQQVLRQIVAAARSQLKADIVALYLYDPRTASFQPPILKGRELLRNRQRRLVSPNDQESIIQFIAERTRPYFVKDAQQDRLLRGNGNHGQRSFTVRQDVQSFVGIPLRAAGRLLAVLCLNYHAPQAFNSYDRTTIQLFAHQATSVIASVQLTRTEARNKLQRDLHDTLQSNLLALHAHLGAASQANKSGDSAHVSKRLHEARRASWVARTDLRMILLDQERSPNPIALEKLIRRQLGQWATNGQSVRIAISPRLPSLPTSLVRAILLIIAEATVNAFEHGAASHALIQLRTTRGRLRMKIVDNGSGFNLGKPDSQPEQHGEQGGGNDAEDQQQTGNGIRNMRQRAAEIDGEMRLFSATGCGTQVLFDLPIRTAQERTIHRRRYATQAGERVALWRRAINSREVQHDRSTEWRRYLVSSASGSGTSIHSYQR